MWFKNVHKRCLLNLYIDLLCIGVNEVNVLYYCKVFRVLIGDFVLLRSHDGSWHNHISLLAHYKKG